MKILKTYRYWIAAVIISVSLYMIVKPVEGATLVNKIYPYWVFNDEGETIYCYEPTYYGQVFTACWIGGVEQSCMILSEDKGYIDCKANG